MSVTESYKEDTNVVDLSAWRLIQRIKILEAERVQRADDESTEHLALLGLLLLQSLDQCNQVLLNSIERLIGNFVSNKAAGDANASLPYSLKDLVIKTKARNSGGQLGSLRGSEFLGCSHVVSLVNLGA